MDLALALGRRRARQCLAQSCRRCRSGRYSFHFLARRPRLDPAGRQAPCGGRGVGARGGARSRGATLYVTLEPCSHHGHTPPCADAIIAAGIRRVVSALEDPNPEVAGQGHARLAAPRHRGRGEACARRRRGALHAGHLSRIRDGRPYVTLSAAVSADSKAGLSARKPAPITGEAARARAHLMRAMNDAILIGIGTALADDPQLTCRLPGMGAPLAGAHRPRHCRCGCPETRRAGA